MRRWSILLLSVLVIVGCTVVPAPRFVTALQEDIPVASAKDRRLALRRAWTAFEREQDDRARSYVEALQRAGYPRLEDYLLFLAGEIAARQDRMSDAQRALQRLLDLYPQSVLAPRAALALGQLLQKRDLDAQARPLLERARIEGDSATRAAANLALGWLSAGIGDVEAAQRFLQEARRSGIGTVHARLAKEEVLALWVQWPAMRPRGEEAIAEVQLRLKEGDTGGAIEEARRAGAESFGAEAARLEELRARALLAAGRTEDAFVVLWAIVEQSPGSPAARDALFRIASTLWNRDRDQAAARAFREFLERYPRDGRAADSLYALGRIHQTAGRSSEAAAAFTELLRRYPRSRVAYDAQWRIGWIAYRSEDWWEAAKRFAELAETSSGRERDAANYWRARSHQRGGRLPRAHEIYHQIVRSSPESYYALLAHTRLQGGRPVNLPISPETVLAPVGDDDRIARTAAPESLSDFHISRWRELRAAGLRQWARAELDAAADTALGAPALQYLLKAYRATDGHARAIRMAYDVGARAGLPRSEYRRAVYPLAFWEVVEKEAKANQLDPLLIVALMRQESMFDPGALSPADARGLMQLLPSTASRVSMLTEGRDVEPAALNDPEVNVRLGTRYLRSLIDRFDGDVFKAIAAYNGGEAAVDKWQARTGQVEIDEFVESISYRETRDYVKRVIGNYETYRALYSG